MVRRGFEDLDGVDGEVFPQDGEINRLTSRFEIDEAALKILAVGYRRRGKRRRLAGQARAMDGG